MRNTSAATRPAIIAAAAVLTSAVVAGFVSVTVNLWIVPSVQRQQRLADQRLEVLVEVADINADYYQGIWNVFFGIQGNEEPEARRSYREQLQRISARSEGIRQKLIVFFKDQTVAEDWKKLMVVYHDAYYPLGREQKMTESELNTKLAPAAILFDSLVKKM